ncbi:MAG: SDR family oxidoreductase [Gordonia sp.]|jgi:3-oxoacyl-[acyl-carrier protein] reductase|uniref:SDR family oxidoreductase n=1 Tax=Gordonia sp. (in: high G+C Gram-positive bacteria) TaxID=84139 RepID=UPI001DBC85BA|nr:SDR family oxidoreductase [Gordonia sp. (in: high G+C Gram-positive bacteria)]MCB1293267.1 SDR family oxidoreductase [Gordonia sp. (in: high G+C Gram-positive bacteria)]HQV19663.1 SDR family oxidoreductase [Gordonia sp. (in: high G+C Gram-positive bacteria)]
MSTQPKTWIITGGSRGIGRAVVERVIARGDRVVSLSRGVSSLEFSRPRQVMEIKTDVTEGDSVARAIRAVAEEYGSVYALVNVAGVHRGGRVTDLSRVDWDLVLRTNLTGAFETSRATVPILEPGGAIVNVGAVVGFRGFPGDVAYGSAKAGLSGMTQVLAAELAPRNIRVNLVVPGFVDTDMTSTLSGRAREKIIASIPAGRIGEASEIAQVIVDVAGATYMYGATVPVDGGLLNSFIGPGR